MVVLLLFLLLLSIVVVVVVAAAVAVAGVVVAVAWLMVCFDSPPRCKIALCCFAVCDVAPHGHSNE